MNEQLLTLITAIPPKEASLGLIVLLLIVILAIIAARVFSKKRVQTLQEFDFSLSSMQRKKVSDENKKKYIQKCFDETIRLLKLAKIKKTYSALFLSQGRTIYTIPLNRKEAVMYIWGKVIAETAPNERDRVIRMASLILGILEENKNKHILELEAQAVVATKIYGSSKGEKEIQIRAVDNVDEVLQERLKLLPLLKLPTLGSSLLMSPEETEFVWPRYVSSSVKKLKEFSLHAIAIEDLYSYTVFPCVSCKSNVSIFDLEDLKCPNCRKK